MRKRIGAHLTKDGKCEFVLWAPHAQDVQVKITSQGNRLISLQEEERGYWKTKDAEIKAGDQYLFQLDNEQEWPDPASQFQPLNVHGPSAVVDHNAFQWEDASWKGMALQDMIIYEVHVGTFSPEGTFEGIISKLDYLQYLGITMLELMPLGQFPGSRNWGYDGVFPFAVQESYGGPEGLKKLVNACHLRGIGVTVDAIYNHLGPEGNYLEKYGPYFTPKYAIPWGNAINFDDAHSDEVRNYFIQNALMWFRDYHVDSLRLDAVDVYRDLGSVHFIQELHAEVKNLEKETERLHQLVGESDLNDPRFITPVDKGGYGLDAQWADEFHHALHTLLTGESEGYYADYGTIEHLKKVFETSYVHTGQYSAFRKRTHGSVPISNPYSQFIVFGQNHDQIGNRLLGDRISKSISFEALKLMAGTYLLSPSIPLIFMGEEFGEENPFQFFISHSDEKLIMATREGRKKDFEHFHLGREAPDPQAEETFLRCKLNWDLLQDGNKEALWQFYKELIQFRKKHPAFKFHERSTVQTQVEENKEIVKIERKIPHNASASLYIILHFGKEDTTFFLEGEGDWSLHLDSSDTIWKGLGKVGTEQAKKGDLVPIRSQSLLVYTKA
jgi:maltooligosyltrehalose trehalohydrolase